jgi:hypothetical protein
VTTFSRLQRFGLTVDLPRGWEGSVFRRAPGPGEETHPVLHAASFPLPTERGDYGNGAVDVMKARDVFIALLEDHPSSVGAAMYAQVLPRSLRADSFNPATLQRAIPGHAGTQVFCTESGRPFCLYVVLGSWALARLTVPRVNAVLATLRVEAG